MSLSRGKRKRRDRRRRDGEFVVEDEPSSVPVKEKPKRPERVRKPLAARSPIVPAVLAVVCVVGAVFTLIVYHGKGQTTGLLWATFYLFLAAVEIFIAIRIYRARGGWR